MKLLKKIFKPDVKFEIGQVREWYPEESNPWVISDPIIIYIIDVKDGWIKFRFIHFIDGKYVKNFDDHYNKISFCKNIFKTVAANSFIEFIESKKQGEKS